VIPQQRTVIPQVGRRSVGVLFKQGWASVLSVLLLMDGIKLSRDGYLVGLAAWLVVRMVTKGWLCERLVWVVVAEVFVNGW
jgi:hypothetical protein